MKDSLVKELSLSLRKPLAHSLEILDDLVTIVRPSKTVDREKVLPLVRAHYKSLTSFEHDFPSFCFDIATGVGKTRLMGAFISYLHIGGNSNNFFVLAPNLTIYNKLIADFTPNTPKYVFKGIAQFAKNPPVIVTGDNYETSIASRKRQSDEVHITIFNISKINAELRGGKEPKTKRLNEYIGESYFDYLKNLPDLVLIMDESHRYRASAGLKAINELNPIMGLELTATPFIESPKGRIRFQNIVYDYTLSEAMQDGYIKEPTVVTQKNFNPADYTGEQLERIKLEDGIRIHEQTRTELETYARQHGKKIVKPFILIIASDTSHADTLQKTIEADSFFNGNYKGKVIQVHSAQSGDEKDEVVERLLRVESAEEKTEIVIHVNMLKEGWDVTNLYTIIPLRAAQSLNLVEQSIERGLRLPYGERTGIAAVDTLSIVSHDQFQKIVDWANGPDSPFRVKTREIDSRNDFTPEKTVVAENILQSVLR